MLCISSNWEGSATSPATRTHPSYSRFHKNCNNWRILYIGTGRYYSYFCDKQHPNLQLMVFLVQFFKRKYHVPDQPQYTSYRSSKSPCLKPSWFVILPLFLWMDGWSVSQFIMVYYHHLITNCQDCHCVKPCLEVCLPCSRLLNDNSKLKSDDYTLWQL